MRTVNKDARTWRSLDFSSFFARFAPIIFLVVLVAIFGILEPNFLSKINLYNVMRQVSITGLIAIGMTYVILTAGIDLSVGSLLALSGLVAAAVAKGSTANSLSLSATEVQGFGVGPAILAAVTMGILAGFLQGLVITKLKVPAFIVTLGGLTIFRGAALILSNNGPISAFDAPYRFWGQGQLPGEIPVPVVLFFGAAVLAQLVLTYTKYGRHIYAVGSNLEAARLSGLRVDRIIISVYMVVGLFAGLAGFLLSSRLNSAEAIAGVGYELTVIAAVILGGTSLFGGEGSVSGTVIGALLIGVLTNGLVLLGISSNTQQIVIGLIIILAVAFDRFIKVRRRV